MFGIHLPLCGMEHLALTDLLAGALFLAVLLYALIGTIRIYRLRARCQIPPPSQHVTLATIVKEVYPDTRLHGGGNSDTDRFPGDGEEPGWDRWLKQKKLARRSFIGAPQGSDWTGARTLHALYQIDTDICAAIAVFLHRRLSAFADLNKPFQWGVNSAWTQKEIQDYDRQFAEHIVEQHLIALRHEVSFPADRGRNASRIVVTGKEFQIRDPLRFDFQQHFETYPGVGIISAGDFFQPGEKLFTLDPSQKTQRLSVLTGTGLDGTIGTDQAFAQDASWMPSHGFNVASAGGVDYQSPYITLGLSSLREIRLLMKRHTDLKTAARNIGLDVAGSGVGGFAGAKAGATIGTALSPGVGSVVGALVGGIGGAIAGRSLTNKIKLAQAEQARKLYEEKVRQFQQRLEEVTSAARQILEATVHREQSALGQIGARRGKELEAATKGMEERIKRAYVLPPGVMRGLFSRTESDIQREEKAVTKELQTVSLWIRVFWPSEDAVRFSIIREHVRERLSDLRAVRDAIFDPGCSLNDVEKSEVSLELIAAFGGHEEEIRSHLLRYKGAVDEAVLTLSSLPPGGIRDLARRRAIALRRIREKANALRRKTEEQLKSDVRKAKRAQSRFARELRKVGLVA